MEEEIHWVELLALRKINIVSETPIRLPFELGAFVTNDKDDVYPFFVNNQSVRAWMGEKEYSSLYHSKAWLVSGAFSDKHIIELQHGLMAFFLTGVNLFFITLWLVKDNCADMGMAINTLNGENNRLYFGMEEYTKSDGDYKSFTDYTLDEINQAINHYELLHKFIVYDSGNKPAAEDSVVNAFSQEKLNKLSRALSFLKFARSSADLGYKIALYFSCLECLFSTSNTEISQRLSQVITLFLEGDNTKEAKIQMYELLKDGYTIRSLVFHGDAIPKKYLQNNCLKLKEIATYTDNVLRKCIIKILYNEDISDLYYKPENDKNLKKYLDSLAFI